MNTKQPGPPYTPGRKIIIGGLIYRALIILSKTAHLISFSTQKSESVFSASNIKSIKIHTV